jgi:hypothetical protein
MRTRSRAAIVLVGVVLLAGGCRDGGATGPRGENFRAMLNAAGQCLAPASSITGPGYVSSRLASLLLVDDPAREIVPSRSGGVVCLSQEDGRWLLRRALILDVAE